MREDYRFRSDKVQQDGGSNPRSILKLVEVLGCRMWLNEDELTVDGTPTAGQFKLQYDGFSTEALDFDADATDVETELNALFSAQSLGIVVACSGGPLPDTPVEIIGDDFMVSKLKPLFGKLVGGNFLSNATWSGTEKVYCSILDSSALKTFSVLEARPTGPHYARGVQTAAIKLNSDKWLLQDCGGTWYAQAYDMANFATDGLKIQFVHGGPAEPHESVNDSPEDESGWSDGRDLLAHPYLGTWHVVPEDCE